MQRNLYIYIQHGGSQVARKLFHLQSRVCILITLIFFNMSITEKKSLEHTSLFHLTHFLVPLYFM